MADGTGPTSSTYDSLRRLTQSTNGAGSQIQYGYDLAGQLTSLTYPGGAHTVSRAYDDAGRLSSVTDWLSHSTNVGYDANSNVKTITYPNTVVATPPPPPAIRTRCDVSHCRRAKQREQAAPPPG